MLPIIESFPWQLPLQDFIGNISDDIAMCLNIQAKLQFFIRFFFYIFRFFNAPF